MKCSTSLSDPVDWWWVPSGGTDLIPIVQSDTMVYLYDDYMKVLRGPDGQQDLVIHGIQLDNAGTYTCFDEGRLQTAIDRGYYASAELVVIGYYYLFFY